ncbi:GNAT family N-acetyltransferase [Haloferula sp. A504]|uniref:GNAT family N-acetyltransferase n=1 Tax=Haloferula sp. A504 TaxID=3373601 RepID=UPI0031BBFF09|nr:N-acetyltransferase [Verrucomicrobiaceae bacterium E54]
MTIRGHKPDEGPALESLFTRVFTEFDSEEEGRMVGRLARKLMDETSAGDLSGFVIENGGSLVAAIFFSRLTFASGVQAFLLGPVAVHSGHQGQGIGQRLIHHGLKALKAEGVEFAVTYGDPRFYGKVGFDPIDPEVVVPPFALSQPEGWLGQSLSATPLAALSGRCTCVPPLNDPAYW